MSYVKCHIRHVPCHMSRGEILYVVHTILKTQTIVNDIPEKGQLLDFVGIGGNGGAWEEGL